MTFLTGNRNEQIANKKNLELRIYTLRSFRQNKCHYILQEIDFKYF